MGLTMARDPGAAHRVHSAGDAGGGAAVGPVGDIRLYLLLLGWGGPSGRSLG